ncbi:hypothetical protein [Bdellovibrio bacteriovorus]|uniref:hypothetical protein n=1 Tax=Bdellovibrio bacteriovorus TaxID=959 RepID=UPI0035A5B21B
MNNFDSGAVTFIDVLGWKGIWARKNSQSPIEKLKRIVENVNVEIQSIITSLIDRVPELHGLDAKSVSILNISDTIVIITKGDAVATICLHGEISKRILTDGLLSELPMRGATSYGEFSHEDLTFMGPAVDEAAAWHEVTNWVGIILTPSALLKLKTPKESWISYQKVPYKSADIRIGKSLVLNWAAEWSKRGKQADDFREISYLAGPLLPEVGKYYLNALDFLEEVTT